jgi:DNA-binding NarL/FixJ family response regulator
MRSIAQSIVETVREPLLVLEAELRVREANAACYQSFRVSPEQTVGRPVHELRADPRTRRLPVVVLTCSREEQDLIESYDLGANSYVRKPADFAQFVEAVRQLQMYWLVLNEAPPERE